MEQLKLLSIMFLRYVRFKMHLICIYIEFLETINNLNIVKCLKLPIKAKIFEIHSLVLNIEFQFNSLQIAHRKAGNNYKGY